MALIHLKGGEAMEEEKKPGFSLSDIRITLMKPKSKNYKEIAAFNTYLLYQENTQRLVGDLPKGMFRLSYSVIENEFEVTRRKAQELMRYFLDNGIIKCVEKSRKKGVGSIYAYTTISYYCNSIEDSKKTDTNCDTNRDTNFDTNSDTNLPSIFNGLNGVSDTNSDTNCDTDLDTNSDTILKYNIKKNKNNKNNNMSDSKESDAPPGAFKDSINTNKKTKSSKKKTTKVFEENSIEYQLSEKFYRKVSEFNSSKYDEKPDLQKWSSEFEKLMRLDKVKSEDIETLIDWIFQEGNFWNDKVQTPAKFRKRDKEEVKYFNKIFKQMEKDPNYYRPSQKDLEKELPPITAEEFYDI